MLILANAGFLTIGDGPHVVYRDVMGQWLLVDNVCDAGPRTFRYAPEDGTVKVRTLQRAVRPAPLIAASQVLANAVADARQPCTRVKSVRGAVHHLVGLPVFGPGPDRPVFAVRLWIGDDGEETPGRPPEVDTFVWDQVSWTLWTSGDGGVMLPKDERILHGAWFLSRIVECEGRDRLISTALEPAPESRWEGSMSVLAADGTPARAFGSFRFHGDGQLRGLVLASPDEWPDYGVLPPTYQRDSTAALLGAACVIDLSTAQFIEWLTPPLPDIAWRYHPGSGDPDRDAAPTRSLLTTELVHPDDLPVMVTELAGLISGAVDEAEVTVRLLTCEGHWRAVELAAARVPSRPARFATVRFTVAAAP